MPPSGSARAVEEACNERFRAFQRLAGLLPDDEEVVLAWNHRNTRAALELLHASAVDHFLIDDFEMSAAMLELLLELDPEDHLEGIVLLAFDYVALDERELFDETIDGVPGEERGPVGADALVGIPPRGCPAGGCAARFPQPLRPVVRGSSPLRNIRRTTPT